MKAVEFSGSSEALTFHSLSKKPSQHQVGAHWKRGAPEKAKAQPSDPNLVSSEVSERDKGDVGQGKSTGLNVQKAGFEHRTCPVLVVNEA